MNNKYYTEFFETKQQKFHFELYEIGLPTDDSVYTLKKVLEELNYDILMAKCAPRGRKGYNPIMLFAVLTYANMRGVKAIDRIVELCKRDIGFIWLTKGLQPKRDVFYDFIKNKLNAEILEDLHYQFIHRLKKENYLTLQELFIDGTKIEANANRYTFVWRGTINYHVASLLDKIDKLYTKYNAFLTTNGYDKKYKLAHAKMFAIEGMERVRHVIKENRKRKKNNKNKLANNSAKADVNLSYRNYTKS